MKTITNILSYLWLLLLMAVTACSDLENEVDEMQQQLQEPDQVELTIQTRVPGMKAGTRAAETENLTTITALVFNGEKELIKKVDNIVTSTTNNTQGTFTLKVPLRTRSIHFIGNLPNDVTLPDVGDSEDELKSITTSGNMSYWGHASFADVTALRAYKDQTLYRNMAKISIEKTGNFNGSLAIAGLENVYKKGILVPHDSDGFNFNLQEYDYQTLPTAVSNEEKGQEKYETTITETYVFEHPNDEGNALFVICLINDKYYKVALAKNNSGTLSYYDIIRNHQYRIKINTINESLGQDSYDAAVNSDPINNAEAEVEEDKQVALEIDIVFYTDNNVAFDNLVFGETNFYLKATIPDNVPAGTTIVLNKTIAGDVNAVHQYYSHYQSDGITNSWTNEMSFTTVAGKTEYLTCWKFVRSDNRNTSDVNISFTLTSTNESVYKLSGETSANITIKGNHNKQILVAMNNGTATERIEMPFEYTIGGNDQLTVTVTVPDGVNELNIEAADFNVSWTDADAAGNTSGNTYKFANTDGGTKEFILTLKEDSKKPKDESLINFAYAADRWTVAPGVIDLVLSEKVVDDGVVIDCDFNNDTNGFTLQGQGSLSSNGALVLNNTEDRTNAWDAQAMYATDDIEYGATYTLTFKAKIKEGTTGEMAVAIQRFENGVCVATDHYRIFNVNDINNVQKDDQDWSQFSYDIIIQDTGNETPITSNPTHFMFNFGDLVGTLYIDDLTLVKKSD